jgi:hypothetical protein
VGPLKLLRESNASQSLERPAAEANIARRKAEAKGQLFRHHGIRCVADATSRQRRRGGGLSGANRKARLSVRHQPDSELVHRSQTLRDLLLVQLGTSPERLGHGIEPSYLLDAETGPHPLGSTSYRTIEGLSRLRCPSMAKCLGDRSEGLAGCAKLEHLVV